MKISMVSEHASPLAALGGVDAGGQNVHVAELSAALARRGHRVTVYTRRDDPRLPPSMTLSPGLELVHVTAGPATAVPKDELLPYMPALAEGIAVHWGEDIPDIVHGHFWMSGVACLDAAARAGRTTGTAPLVAQTFHALGTVKRRHQGVADTSPAERERLEPWVGQMADRVIATCSDEVFELKSMGVAQRRISVAPCGVDISMFTPDGPAEPRDDAFTVATIGRLVPRKGVGTAVSAVAMLKEQGFGNVRLLVVGGTAAAGAPGDDPEVRRILSLARDLGVADQVTMCGQTSREKMPALIRSLDAVICTPWYEPFGIVPLEAMACGRPVVAAAVGGLNDSVVHGRTGLHVLPRDPASVAEALTVLIGDERLRRELGRAGVARVRSRYSWDKVALATERIYARMLGDATGRGPVRRPAAAGAGQGPHAHGARADVLAAREDQMEGQAL